MNLKLGRPELHKMVCLYSTVNDILQNTFFKLLKTTWPVSDVSECKTEVSSSCHICTVQLVIFVPHLDCVAFAV